MAPSKDVRDVVDAGADPTGERPVDDVLASLTAPNTVLRFPPGRYLLDGYAPSVPGLELRGEDVTLVPTGPREERTTLLEFRSDGGVVDGFEFEMREVGFAPAVHAYASDWTLSNLVFRGEMGVRDYPGAMTREVNGVSALNLAVTSSDGVGRLDTVYMHDGAAPPNVRDNRCAIFLKDDADAVHRGRLEVNRLWAERWAENTFYGEYGSGTVHLTECFVRNSAVGVRVAGGATVERCVFVKDGPVPWQRESLVGPRSYNRARGLWLRGGNNPNNRDRPVVVRDCDFVFTDDSNGTLGGPVMLSPPSGHTRIVDTRVRLDADRWPAIKLDPMEASHRDDAPARPRVDLEDVHLESTNPNAPAVVFAREATVGTCSGVVSCPGGRSNVPEVETELTEGRPARADPSPPMPSPPAPGTTPNTR